MAEAAFGSETELSPDQVRGEEKGGRPRRGPYRKWLCDDPLEKMICNAGHRNTEEPGEEPQPTEPEVGITCIFVYKLYDE